MRIILTAAAFISFSIYGYAIQKIFSRDHGIDWRMRALQLAGTVFALVHLWYLWQASNLITIKSLSALAFYAAGLSIFLAAKMALHGFRLTLAFSPDSPQRLVNAGIYSRVRHPFYLAYTLTWIAGAIAVPSFVTMSTTLCMVSFYTVAALLEERKFESSALGTAYAGYREHTGMLWPWF